MKIEVGGKYSSGGNPVRVICTDRRGRGEPIIGLISYGDGFDHLACWGPDGRSTVHGGHDLIPAKPEPVVEWGLLIDGDKFMPGTSRMVAEDALSRGSYGPAARLAKRTTTTEIIEP